MVDTELDVIKEDHQGETHQIYVPQAMVEGNYEHDEVYDKIENEKRKRIVATLGGYWHEQVQVRISPHQIKRQNRDRSRGSIEQKAHKRIEEKVEKRRHMQLFEEGG